MEGSDVTVKQNVWESLIMPGIATYTRSRMSEWLSQEEEEKMLPLLPYPMPLRHRSGVSSYSKCSRRLLLVARDSTGPG